MLQSIIFTTVLFSIQTSFASSHDSISFIQAEKCLKAHHVPYQTRTSSFGISDHNNWTVLTTPYNRRITWEPAIVTLPFTPQQVSRSVTCAAAAGLKIQAKSGGHSYASFSNGGQDGSLIVNMQNFNTINLNEDHIAKVGAGVRLGNLDLELYDQGKRALPHGVCPGVGAGGHFTHGGYGYAGRLWGLALDSIVGLDLVLANGSYVHANLTHYPDIYFAMRGAADSFGVVTSFYLQTRPAPSSVVTFTAKIPDALKNASLTADAFVKLQKTVYDTTLINANISFSVYTNQRGSFTLRGWCIECNATNFEREIFPNLFKGFPHPASLNVISRGWIESLTRLADGVPMSLPLYGYDYFDTFYSKSIVTQETKPLSHEQWRKFWTFVIKNGTASPSPWNTIIDMYGGRGSQINAVVKDSTAFSHRDSLWVIQNNANTFNHEPPFSESIITFIDDLTNTIMDNRPEEFGIYLNCADPSLSATEVAIRGYGPDTYNRLLSIKQKADPYSVFWNPQTVCITSLLCEQC
ncbi:carbohydrate-binding module family 18 protein [Bisporella sp. PMI_857]|nr:carbohydrate-binding module family 18 protein [Bisporella sp. PMI_857]